MGIKSCGSDSIRNWRAGAVYERVVEGMNATDRYSEPSTNRYGTGSRTMSWGFVRSVGSVVPKEGLVAIHNRRE